MSNVAEPLEISKEAQEQKNWYVRFTISHRVEHWVFITSFIILGITGMVQRYSELPISKWIVSLIGGIENLRWLHHAAAIATMLIVIYHIGALGYRVYVNRARLTMLPVLNDVTNVYHAFLYYIGRRKEPPQQGRYTFEEKLEYWAVVWGTIIMAITGFMMWNPIATTRFLPGQFIPAAKVAHSLEAVLAILSILIWHMYQVFIRHFNRSMYTGKIAENEMLHDHPLELADIKAGTAKPPVTPEGIAKRRRIYIPIFSLAAVIMLVGVYFFIAYEETAIETIPPADRPAVFVPFTPTPSPIPLPTPTPAPVTSLTWEGGINQMMESKCVACHNSSSNLGGLDLSDYQTTLLGGNSGPAVVPGNPDDSTIIVIQSAGGHPGQLTDEELSQVSEWIEIGAPEN
ncbi:MAG: cytochrome b/b6 domain-containing protein [Chloroflexota bacterium]|nr:MAG: cytochrome b/b6 domain-containing protein [Chloroflexota bacterium]